MLSLVLLSSFIRRNYSLGVTYLCLWLLLDDVTGGANYIVWSDNAVVRLVVYCDISSKVPRSSKLYADGFGLQLLICKLWS